MTVVANPALYVTEEELAKVEKEFVELCLERDHLLYHEKEILKEEYMEKIGALEYKLYEFQVAYMRLKRKLELIQSKVNKQELVNFEEIEGTLDLEYAAYEQEVKRRLAEVNALLVEGGRLLSSEESKELKSLYKILVKRLHPDLNPGATEHMATLFYKAVKAYKAGNLKELRLVDLLSETISEENNYCELQFRYERLVKQCQEIKEEMAQVRKGFPFNQTIFLENPKLVEQRKGEIVASLKDYKEKYAKLEKRLAAFTAN